MIVSQDTTFGSTDLREQSRQTAAPKYEVAVHGANEMRSDDVLRQEWAECAAASDNLNALFQSPAWWDANWPLAAGERGALVTVRMTNGELAGVIPVRTGTHAVQFTALGVPLGAKHLKVVRVMGCQPLLPERAELHSQAYEALFRAFPDSDCILLEAAESRNFGARLAVDPSSLKEQFTIYTRCGMTPHYVVAIPASFDDYLAKFKSKVRYNLRRQVRRLEEHGAGNLELVRIDRPERLDEFLAEAAQVESQSWQYQQLGATLEANATYQSRLRQLAERGILRCYLLRAGGSPCAMVIGYQYTGTYYYSWCGFAQKLSRLSPGTVLLYLIIEDLCRHDSPRRLTFLWGDASYKRLFATDCLDDTTALIVSPRASMVTRACLAAQDWARRLAERRHPAATTEIDDVQAE